MWHYSLGNMNKCLLTRIGNWWQPNSKQLSIPPKFKFAYQGAEMMQRQLHQRKSIPSWWQFIKPGNPEHTFQCSGTSVDWDCPFQVSQLIWASWQAFHHVWECLSAVYPAYRHLERKEPRESSQFGNFLKPLKCFLLTLMSFLEGRKVSLTKNNMLFNLPVNILS